jgi:hypothetical protein
MNLADSFLSVHQIPYIYIRSNWSVLQEDSTLILADPKRPVHNIRHEINTAEIVVIFEEGDTARYVTVFKITGFVFNQCCNYAPVL